MQRTNLSLVRRAAALPCLWVSSALMLGPWGCGPDVGATREWTAADHGQPVSEEGDGEDQRAAPPPESEIVDEAAAGARAARALWGVSCAGCHGRSGRGDGPTPPPGARMPDFTQAAFQQARTDGQLTQAILEGRGLMPSFAKQLTPQAIGALVTHIRTLAPASGATGEATGKSAEATTKTAVSPH